MTRIMTDTGARLARLARSQGGKYSGDADRPLGGYAITMTVYGAVASGLALLAQATGRDVPDGMTAKDVVLSALAAVRSRLAAAKRFVAGPPGLI